MKKIFLGLVISLMMTGCISTINPDGSRTKNVRGSITWVLNAPEKYVVEYLNSLDTWRICEIWNKTHSKDPWITDTPKFGKPMRASQQASMEAKRYATNIVDIISADSNSEFLGLRMRKRLAKSLESRDETPMICRKGS